MSENAIKYENRCAQNRTQQWVAMPWGLPVCSFCPQSFSALWTMPGCPFTVATPWGPFLKKYTGLCVGHTCLCRISMQE